MPFEPTKKQSIINFTKKRAEFFMLI